VTDPKTVLRYAQVLEQGLDDWRFFLNRLHARFKTGSFVKGLELVTRITEAAEAADHHPDITLTYPQVDVDLHSHDVGGVTSRDVDLARRISALAAELGAEPAPREVSTLELALDVPDAAAVKPFWATVLGYADTRSDVEIIPPRHRRPARARRGAGAGGGRGRRHAGQRRRGARLLGPRRRPRQQGLRLHRRRPGAGGRHRPVRQASQMLGRVSHSDDGVEPVGLAWRHAQGHSRTHAACGLRSSTTASHTSPLVARRAEGFFVGFGT
jgi:pterin-4a-carbinolamine dehydratase